MSDDPDFPKAEHALQVLRQARLSRSFNRKPRSPWPGARTRSEAAAIMVEDLAYETANTGLRDPEIEQAHQAAWVAISALASALKEEGFAGPAIWKAALRATERWKELLT